MKRGARRRSSMPFVITLSFMMGMLTTIAVYSLRSEPPASRLDEVHASEPTAAPIHEDSAAVLEPAATVPTPPSSPTETGLIEALRDRDLEIPVDDVDRDDLRNTFTEARGSRTHEALDIIAPRNTKVVAVEDGRIQKLFTSKAGGLTIYQFDPTETYAYYYAHLERYADGLREGQPVKRGDVIGYVGSTGNASPDAPHLHFAIFRLTPERQWWKGEAINPYPILSEE